MQLQIQFKLPRPRILKSDFRRNYPIIWVNVFNACDYQQMMLHLNTYYERDVTLQQRDLRPPEIKNMDTRPGGTTGSACGVSYLAEFWFKSMNIAPDLVCTLKHTFLKVRSDGTSVIKCCFALTGTKILSLLDNHDAAQIEKFSLCMAGMNEGNAKIGATAAAMAAVVPTKVTAVLRTDGERTNNARLSALKSSTFSTGKSGSALDSPVAATLASTPIPATTLNAQLALSAITSTSTSVSSAFTDTDGEGENCSSDAVSLTSLSGDSLSDYIYISPTTATAAPGPAASTAPTAHTAGLASCVVEEDGESGLGDASTTPGQGQLDAAAEQELSNRFEELSDLESTSGSSALERIKGGKGQAAKPINTKGLSGALKRKLRKAQQLKQKASGESDWISVGQAAFRNGSVQDSGAGLLVSQRHAAHGSSISYTPASTGNNQSLGGVLPEASQVNPQQHQHQHQHLDKESGAQWKGIQQQHQHQYQQQQPAVLTAALDCICSFEMEFNADSRVVSMVLNYIT